MTTCLLLFMLQEAQYMMLFSEPQSVFFRIQSQLAFFPTDKSQWSRALIKDFTSSSRTRYRQSQKACAMRLKSDSKQSCTKLYAMPNSIFTPNFTAQFFKKNTASRRGKYHEGISLEVLSDFLAASYHEMPRKSSHHPYPVLYWQPHYYSFIEQSLLNYFLGWFICFVCCNLDWVLLSSFILQLVFMLL